MKTLFLSLVVSLCASASLVRADVAHRSAAFHADWSTAGCWMSAADKARPEKPAATYVRTVSNGVCMVRVEALTNAVVKIRVPLGDRAAYAGKHMTYRLTTSADGVSEGSGILEGQIDRADEGKSKKHFWKPATFPLGAEPTVWQHTRALDARLTDLTFTYVLREPGIYRLHDLALFEAPDPMAAYEPGRNYLANGGAERGFYATSAVGEQSLRFGTRGGVIEQMKGRVATGLLKPARDDRVFRSGRHSFRLHRAKGEEGEFYFNPVPWVQGRPAVFSFWAKAARRAWVSAGWLIQSGVLYDRRVAVETNWTKVVVAVPSWGQRTGGIGGYGDVLAQKGVPVAVPRIAVPDDVTVWMDDAFATVGRQDGEASPAAFASSARLMGNDRGIYRPGEKVTAEFRLVNLSEKPCTYRVTRKLLAWDGHEATDARRTATVTLEPGEEKAVTGGLVPPSAWRGPMNAVWETRAATGDGAPEVSCVTFGVQPPCTRLARRLSVNVMFGSPEQTLGFLREFGIGTTRLWANGRGWHLDAGYAYSKLFRDNGLRNLLVLGTPATVDGRPLRGETLVPKDPMPWFDEMLRLADAHRGEIDIYEFLNEFNIWGGRMKNPDPARFDDPTVETYVALVSKFRPLLKARHPDVRLAGPCTCSTDLAFIQRFLDAGGGAHVDLITEHAYNANPDCPDYGRTLERGLAAARAAGVAGWAQTEAGACSPNHPQPGPVDRFALNQAHVDLRNMIIAWAKGLDHYSHFMLATGRSGVDWNLTALGNGDNGFEDLPKPALYAFRACADLLGEAPCVAEPDLGTGVKGYVFDGGETRVAAIWQWNGAPRTLRPAGALASARWHDMMGGVRAASDGIRLSLFPVYCVSRLPASELARALRASPREADTASSAAQEGQDASDPNLNLLGP